MDKLNLDFEIMKGNSAKGWSDFENPGYEKGLDTLIAFSGKNSGYIESKKDAKTFGALSYYIPAGFIGDKIKLTGYMKTENVSYAAGLWMKINPNLGFYNMMDKEIKGTNEWNEYEIELDYKDVEAESIEIGVLLAGKGKIWIDDLKVTIDGKELKNVKKKVELTAEIKQSLIKQIQQQKNSLDISSEEKLEATLTPLIESIGNKKIVAIGEDTHGTSEYYKLREAITKRLITEKGFNIVVLENPYDDIEVLNNHIKEEEISKLMKKHLFSIYQTEEMKSFLDWYKIDSIRSNVAFKGMDDSFWVSHELLKDKLSEIQDNEITQLIERLKDAATLSVRKYNRKYKKSGKKARDENELGAFTYQIAIDLNDTLESKGLLTKQLEEYLFNIKNTYINYFNLKNKKPTQSRDEIMAERIAYLAKDPDSKLIVWAHNAHISNIVIINDEIGIMGEKLKNEFGNNYLSIGMSSSKGSYSFFENRFVNGDHDFDDELIQSKIRFQPSESWETLFNEADENSYYFNVKKIKSGDVYTKLKLITFNKETKKDYYKLPILKMFDSLFFLETTNATTPLDD
ncbi:erythromycin esterase family protein [Psychroflexus salinarum]|uniref:Erythromycin esterase family protein n=1 Tax=Psychroflexus salinarum TaxID=546024 RepID=A0ABW3GRT0_9FLAO